jgi:hypothetical protein
VLARWAPCDQRIGKIRRDSNLNICEKTEIGNVIFGKRNIGNNIKLELLQNHKIIDVDICQLPKSEIRDFPLERVPQRNATKQREPA